VLLAHPCLPFRVGVHIGSIVVEEVALNVGLAGKAAHTLCAPPPSLQRLTTLTEVWGVSVFLQSDVRTGF
jgi:hypothetical protein